MRKRMRKKIVSIFFYVTAVLVPMLPVFLMDGEHYTLYQGYLYVKESGIGGVSGEELLTGLGGMVVLKTGAVLMLLYQIVCMCYLVSVLLNKNWHFNIVALSLAILEMGICVNTMMVVSENSAATLLFLILVILCIAELLVTKMMDIWDDTVKTANEYTEKEKLRKEEEKRRLYFPGNYPEQFYRMVWKNFKYDWRDYGILLLCSIVIATLSFAGIGCYQMMAGIHRAENFLIGQGLGLILWNAMIPMGICAIFLMVFVLIFYLRKWMENYSIFITLGIRRKTMYLILALEILFCFLFSVLCGMAFGNVLAAFLKGVLSQTLGDSVALANVTGKTYLLMIAVMAVLYIVSLMASRDILQDLNLIRASGRRVQREKLPGEKAWILAAIGAVLIVISAILYSQLAYHENVYLLVMCFAGVFLLARYGGALCLRKEKEKKTYLEHLMNRNQLYHKSKTIAWYLTALIILYVYAMFGSTFPFTSARIAQEPETLFPYDFVCIADEGDEEFFEEMKEKYGAGIISYPMVRVSNADRTEQREGVMQKEAQGQQIGISETTYHQLKEAVDREYQATDLHLDADGKKVYLVHQQDRSVKAQPIDWTYGAMETKPFLHVGLPCPYNSLESPNNSFLKREIEGEEIGSLIGCFRQGVLENIVVFSDEYFEEAKDMWKYTDIYTGDVIENEEERIEGVTIYQGPTRLVLINAEESSLDEMENEMETFAENHTYEAQFDSEVSCYYSRQTGISDMKTEQIMKQIVNLFMIVVLMITGMLLVYIKLASELKEKKERAVFLNCMGMRRKERIYMLKGEVYLLYWLPALAAVILATVFTLAAFHARMYSSGVVMEYLKNAVWLWAVCLAIQGIFIWIMGLWYVRKVEGRDE